MSRATRKEARAEKGGPARHPPGPARPPARPRTAGSASERRGPRGSISEAGEHADARVRCQVPAPRPCHASLGSEQRWLHGRAHDAPAGGFPLRTSTGARRDPETRCRPRGGVGTPPLTVSQTVPRWDSLLLTLEFPAIGLSAVSPGSVSGPRTPPRPG